LPAREDEDAEGEERRQKDEREGEAVDTKEIVDAKPRDPRPVDAERLERGSRRVEAEEDQGREDERRGREEEADRPHRLLRVGREEGQDDGAERRKEDERRQDVGAEEVDRANGVEHLI